MSTNLPLPALCGTKTQTSFQNSEMCLVLFVCDSVAAHLGGWVTDPVHNLPFDASYDMLEG